jgi:hypothetical protein
LRDLTGAANNRFRIFFVAGASGARTISGSTANTFFDFGMVRPLIQNGSTAAHTLNFPLPVGPDYDLALNPVSGNLTLGGTIAVPWGRLPQIGRATGTRSRSVEWFRARAASAFPPPAVFHR